LDQDLRTSLCFEEEHSQVIPTPRKCTYFYRDIEGASTSAYLGDFINLEVIDNVTWFPPLVEFIEKHGSQFSSLIEAAWTK
jgi:hypothetical protein